MIISVYGPYRGFFPVFDVQSKIEHRINHLIKLAMKKRIRKLKSYNPKLKVILIENDAFDYGTATFRKFSMKNVERLKAAGRYAAWQSALLN